MGSDHDVDAHDSSNHSHGSGASLTRREAGILQRGIERLLEMSEHLAFKPTGSAKYPLPLCGLAYRQAPGAAQVRQDVRRRMRSDPLSVLENVLALLELVAVNQSEMKEHVCDDESFVGICFGSKRANGWIALVGPADRGQLEQAVNAKWSFRFFHGPLAETSVYVLLNMLARYAYVYGRAPFGDVHALSHFVEEHTPGLMVCRGNMSDLELTLSLAAMKMGVPAIVPTDYPFTLGRLLRVDSVAETSDAVVGFANIRRLLDTPEIPKLPEYLSREYAEQQIEPVATWGDSPESFYMVRKGRVEAAEVKVTGQPDSAMGVILTIDAEPMDATDCAFIEQRAARFVSMINGAAASAGGGKLTVRLAEGAELSPETLGEILISGIRYELPKLKKIRAEIIFGQDALGPMKSRILSELNHRARRIDAASEETIEQFYMCVGCSPFAPDHACVLTPERPPQCGRPYGVIKTGAHYAYDDASNIHHSKLHRDVNSYLAVDKGRCLDELRGEWAGPNAKAAELTAGRTRRIFLHSLDEHPHTGCACFRLIMFKTDKPREGIGIMAAGHEGRCPDGRSWRDLRYELTGKQTPGVAGASPAYLRSPKFLRAHGGWDSVVWVCPKIASIMGDSLPDHVAVGNPGGERDITA